MTAPLVERSSGDTIPASDHNDVKDYIEDGTYRVNTLALSIGGTEVITSARAIQNVTIDSDDVAIGTIGSPTYDSIGEHFTFLMSSGKVTGGNFTDNGDGTITVSAGTGLIRATDSGTADLKAFDWSANSSVTLTDGSTNYVYVDYNSGSPAISVSTTAPTDHNTKVLLGLVFRDGTTLHMTEAGQLINNYLSNTFWKDMSVNGKFQYASGLSASESGTRGIAVTSGSLYAGLTKKTISAFDSGASDTYTQYYRDGSGGWTKVSGATAEDNSKYDDGSGTLASLTTNYKTCRYLFVAPDGDFFMVYGQNEYQYISDAIKEDVPNSLPSVVSDVGLLVAKFIVKDGATHFKRVLSAFVNDVSYETVESHNDLSDLQGGTASEYYHLTSSEHTNMFAGSSPEAGGEVDFGAHSAGFTLQSYTGDGTTTIDWTNGNKAKFTFGSQNDTLTFTAPSNPCSLQLIIVQDSTGGRTITWPSTVKWVGGTAPTLSTGASAVDIVSFLYDGTNYYGVASLNFS